MEPRRHTTPKRRLPLEPSAGDESCSSDTSWHASSQSSSTRDHTDELRRECASKTAIESRIGKSSETSAQGPDLDRRQFESWDHFFDYLKGYQHKTYQMFRVKITNSVRDRNNKMMKTGSSAPLIPDDWVQYARTLVCTHSGTYVSRGQGKRQWQETRARECPAQVESGAIILSRFPEVLLIDAIHGTNASKYKMFSFMIHDAFGRSQSVQHAVLPNERFPTLLTTLVEFKANNPSWMKLQCVVIDKNFTEQSVVKISFHGVRVLLCQLHVIKYLREAIAVSDYGFNTWQKEQLRSVLSLLVYAKTEQEYVKHRNYLRHLIYIGLRTNSDHDTDSAVRAVDQPDSDALVPPAYDLVNIFAIYFASCFSS